ncbi:37S ribosomal protein S16, mitochondrial [Dimargaris cristalligena]|nr:37S ribosomal protein S16, mitochondrial [Dimargaris cristalligena]
MSNVIAKAMRIRMKTCGTKIKPMFDIFVARGPTRRRVPVTEYIGKYCILRDQDGYMQLDLNIERAKHWIAEGAIPSNGAREVLEKAQLLPRTTEERFKLKIFPIKAPPSPSPLMIPDRYTVQKRDPTGTIPDTTAPISNKI